MVKPPDGLSVNTHRDDALKQFAESLAAESDVDPATMREALIILCGHLLRKYASISRQDVADVANDAVARVVAKSNAGALRSDLNPTVYLLRTAEHTAIDHLRRKGRNREEVVPHEELVNTIRTDDEAAAVFDRKATAQLVYNALTQVQQSGDATSFRVATYVLDEIQKTGRMPSNRQTAKACGLSHTAVAKALVRLRTYFSDTLV